MFILVLVECIDCIIDFVMVVDFEVILNNMGVVLYLSGDFIFSLLSIFVVMKFIVKGVKKNILLEFFVFV